MPRHKAQSAVFNLDIPGALSSQQIQNKNIGSMDEWALNP